MNTSRILMTLLAGLFTVSTAFAGGKDGSHCEVKKNGKHTDLTKEEAPNRKVCKTKGGKWVKDHAHDHSHDDGADHEHEDAE